MGFFRWVFLGFFGWVFWVGFLMPTLVRRPYRGHEAATEDSMPKRGGGVCSPPMALVWGGRMDQLMVQVERGGSRPGCLWDPPLSRRVCPFQEGRAPQQPAPFYHLHTSTELPPSTPQGLEPPSSTCTIS